MNIVINNFKVDLDRLIDNSVTITSNERKDLVNRMTEIVFNYDARYTILNEMEEYLKGGKRNDNKHISVLKPIKNTKVTFLRLDKGE